MIPKFVWFKGRQHTGYDKMLLVGGKNWDCWILRYPTGSEIPVHTDTVENGKKHYRWNIVLKSAIGGIFYGKSILNICGRIIFFRPDICPHYVTKIASGTRYVLSFGWVTK